jgi:hypothetical protein
MGIARKEMIAMASEMQDMLNAALTGDMKKAKGFLDGGLGINDPIVMTDKSADPQARLDMTALHMAVAISRTEVVQFLLDNGADVQAKDGKGRAPLDLAKTDEIRKLLHDAGLRSTRRA